MLSYLKTYGYLFVLAAFLAGAFAYTRGHRNDAQSHGGVESSYASREGVQTSIVAQTEAPTRTISVMFTGNSFTYVNNLPYMLSRVAEADRGSHLRFEIASDTHGGKTLSEVWRDGQALPLFQSRSWTYVVLQQRSWWVNMPDQIAQTQATIPLLARLITAGKATPLLFLTWAQAPDCPYYKTEPGYGNAPAMQQALDYYTYDIGKKAGVPIVPVGDYWYRFVQAHPDINLYQKDGSHPSMAGTYLAALVFYRFLSQREVRTIDFAPPGLGRAQADAIRAAAAQ